MINELIAIGEELQRARILFPVPINGPHEALGVIMEEFDEFKDEVYAYNLAKGRDTRPKMYAELKQLAAMCIKAMQDVCPPAKTD